MFIKLTKSSDKNIVRLNITNISEYIEVSVHGSASEQTKRTKVTMINDNEHLVIETVEEIDLLIENELPPSIPY